MVVTVNSIRKAAAASRPGDILWLLETKRFSDFEINCGEHTFHVHRAIITQGCEYFKTLTTSSFKEGAEQKVDFKDDQPAVVARLLYFLYTGRCSVEHDLTIIGVDQIRDVDESMYMGKKRLYYAHMYAMAVKLSIKDLARLAACEFRLTEISRSSGHWSELVIFVYNSTPPTARDLKDILVRDWQVYAVKLCDEDGSYNKRQLGAMHDVIQTAPGFGFDIATMPLSRKLIGVRSVASYVL